MCCKSWWIFCDFWLFLSNILFRSIFVYHCFGFLSYKKILIQIKYFLFEMNDFFWRMSVFFETYSESNDLNVDGCQSDLYFMLKPLFFKKFCKFFCRLHSLMNRPCYNNLFQIIKHNFRNLNRVICTQWKHLESRVNAYWYCS